MRTAAKAEWREANLFGEAGAVLLEDGWPHLGVLDNQSIRLPEGSEKRSAPGTEFLSSVRIPLRLQASLLKSLSSLLEPPSTPQLQPENQYFPSSCPEYYCCEQQHDIGYSKTGGINTTRPSSVVPLLVKDLAAAPMSRARSDRL
ncbi:hypothetical protein SAMN05444162_4185 [Paenibacillaceae bacterium GAS479]|nr:hypothetical protein SAMN05444162_4185 [Paenibacillaceae bacterium GAS479]